MKKIDPELLKRMMMGDYAAAFGTSDKDDSKGKSVKNISSIDLHAHKLIKGQRPAPEALLSFQLEKFTEFLEQAKTKGLREVVVIHGKGDDVLRQAIIKKAKTFNWVKSYQLLHEKPHFQGATRFYLG